MQIRPWRDSDLPTIHALNEAAIPAVNSMSEDALRALLVGSLAGLVAVDANANIQGFVICVPEGLDYASDNYRWFSAAYTRFAYIDRVVIDVAARGQGLGKRLYHAIEQQLAAHRPVLLCEVNEEPPNPVSLAFHDQEGFQPVGRQRTDGGTKSVVLLAKDL